MYTIYILNLLFGWVNVPQPFPEVLTVETDLEILIREKKPGQYELNRNFNANTIREGWDTTLDRKTENSATI